MESAADLQPLPGPLPSPDDEGDDVEVDDSEDYDDDDYDDKLENLGAFDYNKLAAAHHTHLLT